MTEEIKPSSFEISRNDFLRLPEFPGPNGPQPKMDPGKFAEMLGRRHPDRRELYDLLAEHRLLLSDSNILDSSYASWVDELTVCVEGIMEDEGIFLSRKLSDNRLNNDFDDLAF